MAELRRTAPAPVEAPIPVGTTVTLDDDAKFHDRSLITGGSPWRLLKLPGRSRAIAERWAKGNGVVRVGEEQFARMLVQQGLLHPHFPRRLDVDDVDVVIPVRDDVASLASLLSQLVGLHVTVVDDGSLNPSAVAQCVHDSGAALVRLEENEGPARARNAGLADTERSFVWFLDADLTLDNAHDVLSRLFSHLDDPLVAAVAPRVRGAEGFSLRERFEQRFSPLDMGPRSGLVVPGGAVGYVPSACLLTRREALGSGFNSALRVGEDVDLVWRLHDEGWLVRYSTEVLVTHRARGTWRQWWHQRVSYGRSAGELAALHGNRLAPLRADVWTLVAWSSVLASKPLFGARIARAAQASVVQRLGPGTDDPHKVAGAVVARGMVQSTGPLARSVVRTYGPLVLVAAFHPRLRRRALALFSIGTAWRWRRTRVHLSDIPLALADDLAYGVGVWCGAWSARSARAVTPHITKSSIGLRNLLGIRPKPGSDNEPL